jgi:hypothetical protein
MRLKKVRKMNNKGAGNRPSFLVYELVKTNSGGPWTDVLARIPARITPYANFLILLAGFSHSPVFPKFIT